MRILLLILACLISSQTLAEKPDAWLKSEYLKLDSEVRAYRYGQNKDGSYMLSHIPEYASLSTNEYDIYPVQLSHRNMYSFAGLCDKRCKTLSLKIFGPDGNLVAEDIKNNGVGITFIAPSTGTYKLHIIMDKCNRNKCQYVISGYRFVR